MPSRKRNKGKERRAKKEAATASPSTLWETWALGTSLSSVCNHGCVIPPPNHAVRSFMHTFDEALSGEGGTYDLVEVIGNTFQKHPEVWNDTKHRQMAIGVLLRMGTNMIMNTLDDNNYQFERHLGIAILALECYDGKGDSRYVLHCAMMKGSVLAQGGERDMWRFYSKRLPCSCFKAKYKHARMTLPKLGRCMHCKQYKERSSLMTCARCKFPFYCSKQCQASNWSRHEHECGIYANIQQRQMNK